MATETSSPVKTPPISTSNSQVQQPQVSTAGKTPVSLSSSSHLDPSAYVRGTHAIQIGPNVLIHPRAHLVSIYSPLTVNEGCIVAEKSILGGPIPISSTSAPSPNPASTSTDTAPSTSTASPQHNSAQTQPTIIGRNVHIHPNVTINSGAQISDFTVLESNVTIHHGVTIGKHSKICAGVTLSSNTPDWTVVYGMNGEHRRRRLTTTVTSNFTDNNNSNDTKSSSSIIIIENARCHSMNAEREATMAILKKAAARTIASRAKR